MIDTSNIPACSGGCALPTLDERFNTTVQEYIEVIRDLTDRARVARVKEIAEARGVKASSVSVALVNLRQLGLIDHEHYGYVSLTEGGRELGEALAQRHQIILCFLHDILGVDKEAADREACKLEHAISPATLDALIRYVQQIEGCPWCDVERRPKGVV